MEWLFAVWAVGIGFVIAWIFIYNGLVRNRLWVTEAWSQIDVQLKRRNDLIPNLVETVKGYATHEKDTLEKVVSLRNRLTEGGTGDQTQTMKLSNQLSDQLRTIFALAEAYPDLKANQSFQNLQQELSQTEDKIAYARQLYNSSVTQYNIKLNTFPNNMVAKLHKFHPESVLETPQGEQQVPRVQF